MIHPTAIVDKQAQIASDVEIGPYAIVDGPAQIGSGSKICAYAIVSGATTIGQNCVIHSYAAVGGTPQDYSFDGSTSYVTIGDGTEIREYVTVHRSSKADGTTRIGNDCMLMAKSHVAHDCQLGNGVVLTNSTECAGHVEIGDNCVISAQALIHQFVRIGRRAMIAATGLIKRDIPPFCVSDFDGAVAKLNVVGLRRAEISKEGIAALKEVFKALFRSERTFAEQLAKLKERPQSAEAQELLDFVSVQSKRGIAGRSRSTSAGSDEN